MTASATSLRAVDVAVLGAGPAGIGAAIAAHAAGRSVLLIDEAPAADGQIYRKVPDALLPARHGAGDTDPDRRAGDALRRELSGSGVRTAFGWRVWSVMCSDHGFRLDAISDGGPHSVEAAALLIATGAIERALPFPGWTTPGVFGLAAATTMLKSQRISPGKRVVVAGAGSLLAAVAAGVVKAGADVAAVVDVNGPAHWLAAAPALALRPRLAAQGADWVLRLLRARVLFHFRARAVRALGDQRRGPLDWPNFDGLGVACPVNQQVSDFFVTIRGRLFRSRSSSATRSSRPRRAIDRVRGARIPPWRPCGCASSHRSQSEARS